MGTNEKQNVVSFPKARAPRRPKTDADHVKNIKKAWNALARAIRDAQNFGLHVDTGDRAINFYRDPRVTRTYK